jgi:hypothetical protein
MSEFRLVDRIRSRVFLVELPGMTPHRERHLIRSCRRLVASAIDTGVPPAAAWSVIRQFVERATARMPTEQERETFIAIMQRVRKEVFGEKASVSL